MAVIKAECSKEEKQKFKEFCELRDQKETAVVRRALKKYMSEHEAVTEARKRLG